MVMVGSPSVRGSTLVIPTPTGIAFVLNQEATVIQIQIITLICWGTLRLFSSGLGNHVMLTIRLMCSLKIANVRLDTKASSPKKWALERAHVVAFHVSPTVVVYFRTVTRFHSPYTIDLFILLVPALID